jgi:ISXO2 transposase-like protein/transposase-like zinc ribbon protein
VFATIEAYPRNLAEFDARFRTEAACRDYLVSLRWPAGFRCPRCGHGKAWPVRTVLFEGAGCGVQTSVLAGTVLQDTRQPLRQWFRAMWWVTAPKTGTSALNLQRVLGLGSYKTAWSWLHKLRRAMVRPDRDRLTGRVEVDETLLGAPVMRRVGHPRSNNVLIGVAVEEDGDGIGRIRMRRLADAATASLRPFVNDVVERGAVVHTDGWIGYDFLKRRGYRHEISFLHGHTAAPSELLPRVHRVVSLLKRWLLGTHQGAITPEHLDYYLDEFTFRFNRRRSRSRGTLFYRLVQQAVATQPAPYRSLIRISGAPDHKM